MITFKRADGELIDDHGWVTSLDYFDDYDYPVELVEERWERKAISQYWHLPQRFYTCEIEDKEPCDEDAVAWWRTSDGWLQVCEKHKPVEARDAD